MQQSIAWPERVRAVYLLCNPEKERERYERLLPHLKAVGVPVDRIKTCAPTWGSDLTPHEIFAAYEPFLQRMSAMGPVPAFTFKAAALTRGEISLNMNFAAIVNEAAKEDGDGYIITLESDVWLRPDFVPRLQALLASAAKVAPDWDYISLGEGVGTRPPGAAESYFAEEEAFIPPHQWVFRCTDSMLFTVDFLRRLSKTILPFKESTDWEMNFQLMAHRGIALWADPPMAEQGTCFNRVLTSLPS